MTNQSKLKVSSDLTGLKIFIPFIFAIILLPLWMADKLDQQTLISALALLLLFLFCLFSLSSVTFDHRNIYIDNLRGEKTIPLKHVEHISSTLLRLNYSNYVHKITFIHNGLRKSAFFFPGDINNLQRLEESINLSIS